MNSAGESFKPEGIQQESKPPQKAVIPPVMHFCAANCMTLTWDGKEFIRSPRYPWEAPDAKGVWTVQSFTPELVKLHRHETGNRKTIWEVDYTGQMSADGTRLINVLMDGKSAPEVRLAWGEALSSVPSDNYVRDAHKAESSGGTAFAPNDPFAGQTPTITLNECESGQCDGTWKLYGGTGTAQWTRGESSRLFVSEVSPTEVVILRVDLAGGSPGLSGIYRGTLQGQSLIGTASWNWDGANWPDHHAEGAWSATITSGQNFVALASKSELPVTPMRLCHSNRTKKAMQDLELQEMSDPNGAALTVLGCAITGVCGTSTKPSVVDAKTGNDGGRYTARDPGSFACRGLFTRDLNIAIPDDDSDSSMSDDDVKKMTVNHATFVEWFRVTPLRNGRYRLTLLPSSIQLAREYTTEFPYP